MDQTMRKASYLPDERPQVGKLLLYALQVVVVMFPATITVALVSGAIADRAKFGSWMIFAGIWATVVYFPVAAWVWGGGWVYNLGSNLGLDVSVIDYAGGTAVHINAGAAALALALVLGKRVGFQKGIHKPHNVPLVMLGAAILWFGWFGFNAGAEGTFSLLGTADSKVGLIVISILFFGGFIRQIIHVFPINLYRTMNSKGSEFQLLQNFNTNLDKNTVGLKLIDPADGLDEGTHIVIIGESANRDHLKAFTPSYPEDTTPWLSSKVNDPDFSLNYMAYSNFPNTLMSLSYAMTSANQYGDMDLSHAVSMVDAARAAGYRTDWISFQNRSSLSSAGVTLIAERSDASFWEKNYDEYAVDVMKKLPPAKRRVLFINIMGSHYTYLARVPADQRGELGISENDPYYGYDLTVAYTDRVIRDIFEYAKAHMNLKSLVYFSDHGENMEHFHSTSPFFYDMVHIPFFVYLSPDYQAAHPSLMPVLKSHEKRPFTNDLAFDTVTGLWQAKTNFYHAAYDISSPDYAITMEDAKTFGGKRMVKDDPALAK